MYSISLTALTSRLLSTRRYIDTCMFTQKIFAKTVFGLTCVHALVSLANTVNCELFNAFYTANELM